MSHEMQRTKNDKGSENRSQLRQSNHKKKNVVSGHLFALKRDMPEIENCDTPKDLIGTVQAEDLRKQITQKSNPSVALNKNG